jgi:HAD superfamily hydrolase (TIGR01509 family)
MTEAVLFDVDFTLIYPGRAFQGEGYAEFGSRYGMRLNPARFDAAVTAAAPLLDTVDHRYHDALFVCYTRAIIEGMGGEGESLEACAREMYNEWALCHHFHLYDDARPALTRLAKVGIKAGLISNSHRSLDTFQAHFDLEGLIVASVSSFEHGYLKPHPGIFEAALAALDVAPAAAVMVGDSFAHDVEGALGAGMRAVLLSRSSTVSGTAPETVVPMIRSLSELERWL